MFADDTTIYYKTTVKAIALLILSLGTGGA